MSKARSNPCMDERTYVRKWWWANHSDTNVPQWKVQLTTDVPIAFFIRNFLALKNRVQRVAPIKGSQFTEVSASLTTRHWLTWATCVQDIVVWEGWEDRDVWACLAKLWAGWFRALAILYSLLRLYLYLICLNEIMCEGWEDRDVWACLAKLWAESLQKKTMSWMI